MVILKVLNVLSERVNPFYQFVCLVISIKNLVYAGFVKLNAFLDDMNFVECFEMGGLDLFDESGSLLISLDSLYLLIVLIFWVFLELFSLLSAHLEGLFGKFFTFEGEIMVYFVETDITCSDELLNSQSFLNWGHFISE